MMMMETANVRVYLVLHLHFYAQLRQVKVSWRYSKFPDGTTARAASRSQRQGL